MNTNFQLYNVMERLLGRPKLYVKMSLKFVLVQAVVSRIELA